MATFQPLFTPPTTLSFGQRASVKKTSLNSAEPSGWMIGPHLDAGLVHRHEQVGDAGVLGRGRVGAGQQEHVVGVLRLGGPDLLAVDHPLVAVELGPGLAARRGRSPPRAREKPWHQAISPERILGRNSCFCSSVPHCRIVGPDEGVAEEVGPHRGVGPGELLVQHHRLHGGEALAAVLRRPGGADPAALVELLRPTSSLNSPAVLARQLEALVEPALRAGSPRARPGSPRGTASASGG